MKNKKITLLILALCLTLASCAPKKTKDSRVVLNSSYEEAILKSRNLMIGSLITNRTGMSITVTKGDECIWSQGLGYSSVELESLVKPEHRFRIGTSSRLFASLVLLRLHERGEIDMQKKYTDYIKSGVNPTWSFTLYQLAVNSAGFPVSLHEILNESTHRNYLNLDSLLVAHASDALAYEPNRYFAESSFSTCLLINALEEVSGKSYSKLLQEEVLTPFGLEETGLDYANVILKNKASMYARNSIAQLFRAADGNINAVSSAVGILSTADDLNKLGQALMNRKVLTAESYQLLLTANILSNGEPTPWGMGLELSKDSQGRELIVLRGMVTGGASLMLICPAEKFVMTVCGNLEGDYSSYPFTEVVEAFLGGKK
ncbi:MAG: serine hydrolase domain-containing protein [Mangrovibacterium sp.]